MVEEKESKMDKKQQKKNQEERQEVPDEEADATTCISQKKLADVHMYMLFPECLVLIYMIHVHVYPQL
jgi:hypothetical protein